MPEQYEGNETSRRGRPCKAYLVRSWRDEHPDGTKDACKRDTGLLSVTIDKWWDIPADAPCLKPRSQVIREWCKEHPDGAKAECQRETGISMQTINRWWTGIEAVASNSKYAVVRRWQEEHPGGTKVECKRDTGLGHSTIGRWWDKDLPGTCFKRNERIVRSWCDAHPNGTMEECAKDLGLCMGTVRKWWCLGPTMSISIPTEYRGQVEELLSQLLSQDTAARA